MVFSAWLSILNTSKMAIFSSFIHQNEKVANALTAFADSADPLPIV